VGLQGDVVLEQFVIEHGDQEQLERKYPVSIVPVALFKPAKLLTLVGGVGGVGQQVELLQLVGHRVHRKPAVRRQPLNDHLEMRPEVFTT
jgi:hypothetical protein